MPNDTQMSDPPPEKTIEAEQRRPSSAIERFAFPIAMVSVAILAVVTVIGTEWLRHDVAMKRIEVDRELARGAQEIERLRIEKATALAATQSAPANIPLSAGGAAGLELLRELIAKGLPIAGGSTVQTKKRSTSAIASLVDALASAGQITASEAKGLKDDLQKAGIEIGVDAAKALIDRFIKVHDKPHSGADKDGQTFQGTTQVNMYCGSIPAHTALPRPRSSSPKNSCSGN